MAEHIARCGYCPGVEVLCVSEEHKAKVERTHQEKWHGELTPGTDALCDELVATHVDERDAIVKAIRACAVVNNGRVDPNVVRQMLPPGITPQLIGATYNVLRRQGVLEPAEQGVNQDAHGRNQGKPMTIYRLVEAERSASA